MYLSRGLFSMTAFGPLKYSSKLSSCQWSVELDQRRSGSLPLTVVAVTLGATEVDIERLGRSGLWPGRTAGGEDENGDGADTEDRIHRAGC